MKILLTTLLTIGLLHGGPVTAAIDTGDMRAESATTATNDKKIDQSRKTREASPALILPFD
ncbi:MAG: hypothetical protein CL816_01860 [Coxiellaceae bacterium]|mgnify:CR=1 FL=1|nr:hypothetical protein [Coxiellaceae bacterium]|tara:strand:- start:116 stop:298 length:183 start_codon:yes stop_codon:yes gene_type:complete